MELCQNREVQRWGKALGQRRRKLNVREGRGGVGVTKTAAENKKNLESDPATFRPYCLVVGLLGLNSDCFYPTLCPG